LEAAGRAPSRQRWGCGLAEQLTPRQYSGISHRGTTGFPQWLYASGLRNRTAFRRPPQALTNSGRALVEIARRASRSVPAASHRIHQGGAMLAAWYEKTGPAREVLRY